MENEKTWRKDLLWAVGIVLIIFGVFGTLPAGPAPTGNIITGTIIWLGTAIPPIALGAFMVFRGSR